MVLYLIGVVSDALPSTWYTHCDFCYAQNLFAASRGKQATRRVRMASKCRSHRSPRGSGKSRLRSLRARKAQRRVARRRGAGERAIQTRVWWGEPTCQASCGFFAIRGLQRLQRSVCCSPQLRLCFSVTTPSRLTPPSGALHLRREKLCLIMRACTSLIVRLTPMSCRRGNERWCMEARPQLLHHKAAASYAWGTKRCGQGRSVPVFLIDTLLFFKTRCDTHVKLQDRGSVHCSTHYKSLTAFNNFFSL